MGKDRHGLIHSLKRVKKKKTSKSSFCEASLLVGTISSVSNDVCDVGKDVRVKLLADSANMFSVLSRGDGKGRKDEEAWLRDRGLEEGLRGMGIRV